MTTENILPIRKKISMKKNHPRIQREIAGIVTRPLSIMFEKLWRSGDISDGWRKASITPIFSKAFDSFPQLPPRQTGKLQTGWVV